MTTIPLEFITRRYEHEKGVPFKDFKDTDTLRYYNAAFVNQVNNTSPFNSLAVPASLSETRTTALLEDPSEWLMSVVRFDIDARGIPIFFPQMQTLGGILSQTATQSFITLRYLGVDYTQNVVYVPNVANPFTAIYPMPAIYEYQQWLDYINTAMRLAFVASGAPGVAPLFIFDPLTQLINLYVDGQFIPSISGANTVQIFMNPILGTYFYNFQFLVNNNPPVNNLTLYQLLITDNNASVIPFVRDNLPLSVQLFPNPSYVVKQSAQGTATWTGLRSIILTSTTIPFKTEFVTTNVNLSGNYLSSSIFPIKIHLLIKDQFLNIFLLLNTDILI
jgi:hypothetical protein